MVAAGAKEAGAGAVIGVKEEVAGGPGEVAGAAALMAREVPMEVGTWACKAKAKAGEWQLSWKEALL